jgi:uncharacterized PurR-regulated membrane protein YhhQ (DUF165 family)
VEPIAAGFMRTIAGAAVLAVLVGALGGACVWWARIHIALGALLTACAYVLLLIADHHGRFFWLNAELTWGAPILALTFLVVSLAARWLGAHARWRPTLVVLVSFGVTLVVGLSYQFLFRLDMQAPLRWAWMIDAVLVLLLLRYRKHAD